MTAYENPYRIVRGMPDVADSAYDSTAAPLDWVGMSGIRQPLVMADGRGGEQTLNALIEAFVDLADPAAKGIHMSRLFLALDELGGRPLAVGELLAVLARFLQTHDDISEAAAVVVRFDYLRRQTALKSGEQGWLSYPVTVTAKRHADVVAVELALRVAYSSTCPCSAALARQLIQQRFSEVFDTAEAPSREAVLAWLGTEAGIVATPHSQRSEAAVRVLLAEAMTELPIADLVDVVEQALKTPVQAAVKREDEQAFALLNGQNLMFCEDAARRVHAALDCQPHVRDFRLRVAHYESLHAHDAVAWASKGIPGGLRVEPGGDV